MRRPSSRSFAVTLCGLLVLCTAAASTRKPSSQPCTEGRFLVRGTRLIPGSGAANEAVVIAASSVAISTGCQLRRAKVKPRGTSTRVVARWHRCDGLADKATLTAVITASDCATMTGVFKARKSRIHFMATRSVCGDGIFDPDRPGEQCDDNK